MKISGIVDNKPRKKSLTFGDVPDSSYYFTLIHFIMVYITKQTVKVSEPSLPPSTTLRVKSSLNWSIRTK